jgi:hypothetical protein
MPVYSGRKEIDMDALFAELNGGRAAKPKPAPSATKQPNPNLNQLARGSRPTAKRKKLIDFRLPPAPVPSTTVAEAAVPQTEKPPAANSGQVAVSRVVDFAGERLR